MRIAVITTKPSDLSCQLEKYAEVTYFTPEQASNLCDYDAYAVLGGTDGEQLRRFQSFQDGVQR